MIRSLLASRVSIGQLVAIGLVLSIPYGIVGLIWAFNHTEHLDQLAGLDHTFSFIGEIIAWPALVISDVTLR